MKLGDKIVIAGGCFLGFFLACLLFCAADSTTVHWIGNPAVCAGDQWSKNVGWLPDYEIGFRSDGVVVWRKAPATTNAPRSLKGQ